MTHTRIKLLVAGTVIAAAVTFLAIAGVREGWVYFLPVDQYVDANAQYAGQRVRLHGKVSEHEFDADRAMLVANFDLQGARHSIRVQYAGVIPEMFDVGRDVVVEGKPDDAGVFHADTLMTKCASKYESADGQAPHADPHKTQGVEASQ